MLSDAERWYRDRACSDSELVVRVHDELVWDAAWAAARAFYAPNMDEANGVRERLGLEK